MRVIILLFLKITRFAICYMRQNVPFVLFLPRFSSFSASEVVFLG